jgi:hypothetical protein
MPSLWMFQLFRIFYSCLIYNYEKKKISVNIAYGFEYNGSIEERQEPYNEFWQQLSTILQKFWLCTLWLTQIYHIVVFGTSIFHLGITEIITCS